MAKRAVKTAGQAKAEQRKAFIEAAKRAKPFTMPETDKKIVVSIGFASAKVNTLDKRFNPQFWHEIRVDSDARVSPDLHCDIRHMTQIPDNSVDGVWVGHVLHRLTYDDAETVIKEILRIVKEGGDILVTVPDLQLAATYIARSEDESVVYHSPAGAVYPTDMLFGFRKFVAAGDASRMHRSGYTAELFGRFLRDIGVSNLIIIREAYDLLAHGKKYAYGHPERVERISLQTQPAKRPQAPAAAQAIPQAVAPVRFADVLETEPQLWKPLGLSSKK